MAAALVLAGLALVGATPPTALWTADLSRLGQDVWTVAFGSQSNLVFAFAEWGGLVALDPVTGHTVWEAHASGIARAELTEVRGTPEHPNVLDVSGWVGFDAKTGVVLWNRTAATAGVSASPPFSAPPESPADVAATAPAVTRAGASSVKAGSTDGTSVGELAVMTDGSDVLLYDAATGATVWRAPQILGNVACGATLVGSIVAVATSYGEVAPTGPAELVTLNASDGALLWRHSLGVGFTCSGDTRPLISIPAAPTSTQRRQSATATGSSSAATVILVPTVNYAGGAMGFGGLFAFDARTGSKMWSAKTRQGAGARWVTAATIPGVGGGQRTAFFGDTRGGTFAVDVLTGGVALPLVSTAVGLVTPIVTSPDRGLIMFGGSYPPNPFYSSGISALDAGSGQQLWTFKPRGGLSNRLAFGPTTLFLGTSFGNTVVALNFSATRLGGG
jgi:hypothetical protein